MMKLGDFKAYKYQKLSKNGTKVYTYNFEKLKLNEVTIIP